MNTSRSLRTRAVMALLLMVGFYGFAAAIAGGLLWIPYAEYTYLDRIDGRLAAFCVFAAGTILWALVPRIDKFEAPGPRLTPANAPYLFSIIEEVAKATKQPRPQEVYLLGDVNAFVTHRGGMMGIGSKRVMGVGLPLLKGFTPAELRSVIAHEFGHFVSGDVALGPWIYKTRFAIYRTVDGVSRWRPIAWLFETYMKMFMRMTMQISREQEFVADATAARVAGVAAAVSAMQRLQFISPAYSHYIEADVMPVVRAGFLPPVNDGFDTYLADPEMSTFLHDYVAKSSIGVEAGEYDSHPPLPERIAALERMKIKVSDNPRDAKATMIKDGDRLLRALLEHMWGRENVVKLKSIAWQDVGQQVFAGIWMESAKQYSKWLGTLTADQIPADKKWFISRGYELARMHEREDATADQKIDWAILVLTRGIGSALLLNGWTTETGPGRPLMFRRDGIEFEPRKHVYDLVEGKLSVADWQSMCASHGLAGVPLAVAAAPPKAKIA